MMFINMKNGMKSMKNININSVMSVIKFMKEMRHEMCSIFLFLLFLCPFKVMAQGAMVVTDPGAYIEMAKELEAINNQIKFAESQLKSIDQTIKQLGSGQYQWSNVQGVINDLGNTIHQADGLSYKAANIDQQFKQYFPGYQAPTNYLQSYKEMVNKTQNTLNGVLQSMGASANDFTSEQNRLNFLQSQAQSAEGQTQALQAASQIASEQVSQLHLLRQTLIAQTNAQTTYYAYQVQKEAQAEAELRDIINAGSTTSPPIGHSGYSISVPEFK